MLRVLLGYLRALIAFRKRVRDWLLGIVPPPAPPPIE
jgi:hypothetical protein